MIAGLDPAALFALADDASVNAPGNWQPPSIEEAAKLFPNWKVLGLLGRGGMGAVYHVHQPDLDREVAVKLLPLEASRNEHQVERFRREARTLAKLRHPGIVALHEAGITPAGHFFFVMEYVDGFPLSALIADGKVDVAKAIEIVRQVCDALAYAHAQGIVHRDIKPSNILIDKDGHARVADFGLARWEQGDAAGALDLSRTGMFMGTPAYTAPEQARDAAHADHRADLYSLGVLLYEMLTGEVPRGVFQPPSRKSGSDARLDDVVQRALQERPEDRYQAASELKQDVTSVGASAATSSQSSPRRFPWAAVLIVVMLLGAVVTIGSWLIIRSTFESLDKGAHPRVAGSVDAVPSPQDTRPPEASAKLASPLPKPLESKPAATVSADTRHVAEVNQPIPTSPPPMPATPSTVPVVVPVAAASKSTAKVWSINPLSPALSPPDEVMKQAWKNCALIYQGGAVLLEDEKTLVFWSETKPGTAIRYVHDRPIADLATTQVFIAVHDKKQRVLVFTLDGLDDPIEGPEPVDAIFSSSCSRLLGVITSDGKAQGWSVESGKITVRDFPFIKPEQLAISSERSVFCLDEAGGIQQIENATKSVLHDGANPAQNIVAGRDCLWRVLRSGELLATGNLKGPLPPLSQVEDVLTGDGFTIARDARNKLTIWGDMVPDSPQRMKMPEGTTHLTASPSGLIAAW